MRRSFLLVASLVANPVVLAAQERVDWNAMPVPATTQPYMPPLATSTKLPNGAKVVYVRRTGLPLTLVTMVARAGSAVEPPGRRGAVALLASVLGEGSAGRNRSQQAEAIGNAGVTLLARSDRLSLQVTLATTSERLEAGLNLFAEMMLRPTFDSAAVDGLRQRQLATVRSQRDAAGSLALHAVNRSLYPEGHPEGRPNAGFARDLEGLTLRDLRAVHHQLISPANVTFVVVTNLAENEIVPLVARAVRGTWPGNGRPTSPSSVAAPPHIQQPKIVLVDRPGAAQSVVRVVGVAPRMNTVDRAALEVANMVASGSSTSRVESVLRAQKGYVYEARSILQTFEWSGRYQLPYDVDTKSTVPALRATIDQLASLRSGISDDEVSLSKAMLARAVPNGFMTLFTVAGQFTDLVVNDVPLDYYAGYAQRINALSKADIERVIKEYLDPDHLVIVVVGDLQVIESGIRALGYGAVEVLDAKSLVP